MPEHSIHGVHCKEYTQLWAAHGLRANSFRELAKIDVKQTVQTVQQHYLV